MSKFGLAHFKYTKNASDECNCSELE